MREGASFGEELGIFYLLQRERRRTQVQPLLRQELSSPNSLLACRVRL